MKLIEFDVFSQIIVNIENKRLSSFANGLMKSNY